MNPFVLSCSSTIDQPKAFFEERGIPYICFRWISDDGEAHLDDLGESLSFEAFYERMKNGALPTTSQPNFQDFTDFFESFLRDGKDVLHIELSSAISGAYSGAVSAANALQETYPERRIEIIDSKNASMGYAMIMDAVWQRKQAGMPFEDCVRYAEACRERAVSLFYSTDLTWYVRGGRVKPIAGLIGNMLNICPILHIDREGALIPHAKVRGKGKAAKDIVKQMEELSEHTNDYDGPVYIVHSDCLEEAQHLGQMIAAQFPKVQRPIHITSIGCVIGSHTGPGTVAVAFWGDQKLG